MLLPLIVAVPSVQNPPPPPLSPAELPVTLVLVSNRVPKLKMPPPILAKLPLTVLSVRVMCQRNWRSRHPGSLNCR